ncbi:uncharacterized protein Dwil_GK13056, isoform B [Drosophila willistoni]|uniref:Uncharacterized protein, isoform B n=1 Tax=Drosophila willistoni TaxID=7260 RepID=A0A0Q9X5A3_DROWI|nr:protein D3 [Drosophila willistoni]KRG00078.1 uncharacterized protein Dwil_GK13056, isoform B [Drosophila willistoni]
MFLICFMVMTTILGASSHSVEDIFKSHEVVPDVVSEAPNQFLQVTYSNGLIAKDGVELTPTQVKDQPLVEWNPADVSDYYTLIMTDPDAPSRSKPTFREFKHWVVVNIPGNDVAKGEVLAGYVGSGPPKDTGLHRYVFLLYKQSRKLEFDEERVSNRSRKDRPKFSAAKFAEKYQLGQPIAGNLYQAQYDDYVPQLHKQLSET